MIIKVHSSVVPASQPSSKGTHKPIASVESADRNSLPDGQDKATLSSLASRLYDSAVRAEKRDSELGHKALADKATELKAQIMGPNYYSNREKHDSFVPDTDDLEWLERAKQSSDFIKSVHNGTKGSVANPFAGLSNEQLVLITYDDSGAYTINERQAAFCETSERDNAWRTSLIARGDIEYSQSGGRKEFFKEILDHYQALPAIERARYPLNYAAELQTNMNRPNDPLPVNANPAEMRTLFDLLFPPREDLSESLPVA